ncbi:TonB-dependent receptor [Sphingomonas sp.]|uniref:TonB-dependent receptor n=1 Tax=Sphingomonas sp. TaxID=28214 RepID=UPI0031D1DEF4
MKTALLVAAAAPAFTIAPALAQDAEPQPEQDIVVTGSRLPSTDLTSAAPVTVLDRTEIDQTGAASVGELLRELPVATASASDSAGRGNGGSATVALRGLSPVNTLVLINGRRVLSNTDGGTVDLNSIPFEAIERVEVLQDGASAIYGSDAIAGVVNLIMRKDFDGLLLKGGAGVSSRGDLPNRELSATFGKRFERGSILANVSWRESEGNLISARPVSRDVDWRDRGGRNFRDPLPPLAVVTGLPGFGNTQMILRNGIAQAATVADFRPANFPDTEPGPNDGINFWDYESSASDISQLNVFVNGNYELTDGVKAFVEASYTRRKSLGFLAPDYFGAVFGDPITLSANNDYNPFGVDLDIARTIAEQPLSGRRQSNVTSDTYRVVAGLEGSFGSWNWDVSYNYQRLDQFTNGGRGVLRSRLQQAAGDSDVCRAANNGCIPINLLGGPGSITQEMLDSISADSWTDVTSNLQSAVANINGTLFALPAGDVRMAIGAEYRRETYLSLRDENSKVPPNSAFISRGLGVDARPPARNVSEIYGEIAVPILKDTPFFYRLDLELAGRFSHYDQFGDTTNPKVGVKWRPIRDLLLRGSWGTGFRAPTFAEAFGGTSRGFSPINDPCSGANFASFPNCGGTQAQLVTGSFVVTGGNPNLVPETADNLTIGAVFTPSFIPRLSLTVDFYRIKKDGVISTIDRNYILLQNAIDGSYAERITRNAQRGVTEILATRENLLNQKIQGVDVGFEYTTANGPLGRFNFRADATYLDSWKQPPAPGADPVERVGTYTDALGTLARYRATGRITWQNGPFTLTTAGRYVGPVRNDSSLLVNGEHLRAGAYFQNDWLISYDWEEEEARISFAVENIFDRMPPFLEGNYSNGFDQATFNSRGRFFSVRVQKGF